MKRAQFSFALIAVLSTVFMVACGSKSSSTGSTPLNTNNKPVPPVNQVTKSRLTILNEESLQKMVAVNDGNPEVYAVQGRLETAQQVEEASSKLGVVACMTTLTNMEFKKGDVAVSITTSISPKNPQVHVMTITPATDTANPAMNAQAQAAGNGFMLNTFEIICMKTGSVVTNNDAAQALQGIAVFN